MPSHGVDIIDGIPVLLKDGLMYAFQLNTVLNLQLGTYDSVEKKAVWSLNTTEAWLQSYKETLQPRSRK